jgi:uncharacterized membrane protein (UPF0136 family)
MHLALAAYFSLFGLVALGGGVMGYVKAKSRASLIAGGASGVLLWIASGLLGSGHVVGGAALGGVVSLALVGRFLPAFLKTKKAMPAGLVAALGVGGVLGACVAALR